MMKRALLALLMSACSGPAFADSDLDVRGKPGDRLDLVCETVARCYIAANEVCEVHDVLCIKRDADDPCEVGPEPGIHMLMECR